MKLTIGTLFLVLAIISFVLKAFNAQVGSATNKIDFFALGWAFVAIWLLAGG